MTSTLQQNPKFSGDAPKSATRARPGRRKRSKHSLLAHGEPMVWLIGTGLALSIIMILSLLTLVLVQGTKTFWPRAVVNVQLHDGTQWMGEVNVDNYFQPTEATIAALPPERQALAQQELDSNDGWAHRRMIRIGNYELTNEHFKWVSDFETEQQTQPEWAVLFERLSWGRFYGEPTAFLIDDEVVADEPAQVWAKFTELHPVVRERWSARRRLEKVDTGAINHAKEQERLRFRALELKVQDAETHEGRDSAAYKAAIEAMENGRARYDEAEQRANVEFGRIREQINQLDTENERYKIRLMTSSGVAKDIELSEVVRAYLPNQVGLGEKVGIYLSRWREFLLDDPREANMEGGVFPAIFGTVVMTVLMSLAVVPFGVLAALYLREYAKPGPIVSAVRIAVNNLAGVPSIVFGVFGLGFFCYVTGATIDQLFYSAKLPSPTFGTGGILWASLTLSLLALPVVIVATEEALAAVPGSMRDGSYACGASKWQTIWRIVLPRAMPGIMTGMILAMARGAGEVAPLMLVGAVKLAPELPIDGYFPYVHMERSFMHLGFHIYDLGFQSQNAEAAKPMVFTTTLLLILLIATLNISAIYLRGRLRRRFQGNQF
jgi:phosphate transport system permease protein